MLSFPLNPQTPREYSAKIYSIQKFQFCVPRKNFSSTFNSFRNSFVLEISGDFGGIYKGWRSPLLPFSHRLDNVTKWSVSNHNASIKILPDSVKRSTKLCSCASAHICPISPLAEAKNLMEINFLAKRNFL